MASKRVKSFFGTSNKKGIDENWTQQDDKLLHAVRKANAERVVNQLKKGGDPFKPDPFQGTTAFHQAASDGKVQLVDIILNETSELKIDTRDHKGQTALHCAIQNGHTDVTQQLLMRNADVRLVNTMDQRSALHMACDSSHIDIVKLLLDNHAPLNFKDKDGITPLGYAASRGQAAICRLLLESGADINDPDAKGTSPLIHAVLSEHSAVCEYLVTKGADVTATDNEGNSALSHAVRLKQSSVRKLLEKARNPPENDDGKQAEQREKDNVPTNSTAAQPEPDPDYDDTTLHVTSTPDYEKEMIGDVYTDPEDLSEILDESGTSLRDAMSDSAPSSAAGSLSRRAKLHTKEFGLRNENEGIGELQNLNDLSDIQECKKILQQQNDVLHEHLNVLNSVDRSHAYIGNELKSCCDAVEILTQRPSTNEEDIFFDTEAHGLKRRLDELINVFGPSNPNPDSIDPNPGTEDLPSLIAKLREEHTDLHRQNELLEQRVQTVEMRLSQTNVLALDLDRAKSTNHNLKSELNKLEALYRNLKGEKRILVAEIETLKMERKQHDNEQLRFGIDFKPVTSPRDFDDTNFTDEIDVLKRALDRSRLQCQEMERLESTLRREIEDAFVLTEQLRDKMQTKLENSFLSEASSPRDIKFFTDEIERLKDALDKSRKQHRDVKQDDNINAVTVQNVAIENSSQADKLREIQENEYVHAKMAQMARTETALRNEIEDTLMQKEMPTERNQDIKHSVLDGESTVTQDALKELNVEIARLKQELDETRYICRDLTDREAALQKELADEIQRNSKGDEDKMVVKMEHNLNLGNNKLNSNEKLSEEIEQLKLELNRSLLQCKRMENIEKALRIEVEDALIERENYKQRMRDENTSEADKNNHIHNSQLPNQNLTELSLRAELEELLTQTREKMNEKISALTDENKSLAAQIELLKTKTEQPDKQTQLNMLNFSPIVEVDTAKTNNQVYTGEVEELKEYLQKARNENQDLLKNETKLRGELKDLMLRLNAANQEQVRTEHITNLQSAPDEVVDKQKNMDEIERLKLDLEQLRNQCKGMSQTERNLRTEIEELLLREPEIKKEVEVRVVERIVTVESPPQVVVDEQKYINEIEQLKRDLEQSRLECKNLIVVETGLRKEIEDLLLRTNTLMEEQVKVEHITNVESAPVVVVDEQKYIDEIERLKRALDLLQGELNEMSRTERSLRNEMEELLLREPEIKKEVEVRVVERIVTVESPPQVVVDEQKYINEIEQLKRDSDQIRQELAMKDRDCKVYEDKILDFADRFNQQGEDYNRSVVASQKKAFDVETDNGRLVAELELLKLRLASEASGAHADLEESVGGSVPLLDYDEIVGQNVELKAQLFESRKTEFHLRTELEEMLVSRPDFDSNVNPQELQGRLTFLTEKHDAERAELVKEIESLQSQLKDLATLNVKLEGDLNLRAEQAARAIEELEEENAGIRRKLEDSQLQLVTGLDDLKFELERSASLVSELQLENEHLKSYQPHNVENELRAQIEEQLLLLHEKVVTDVNENTRAVKAGEDNVSEQEIAELNERNEKLKVENLHLKSEIDNLRHNNDPSRVEMQLRAEIEELIMSRSDEKQHQMLPASARSGGIAASEISAQNQQIEDNLCGQDLEDLLNQLNSNTETEGEFLVPLEMKETDSGRNFARNYGTRRKPREEGPAAELGVDYPQNYAQHRTPRGREELPVEMVQTELIQNYAEPPRDTETSDYESYDQVNANYASLLDNTRGDQSGDGDLEFDSTTRSLPTLSLYEPDYVTQLEMEVELLREANHDLTDDVRDLQDRLAQCETNSDAEKREEMQRLLQQLTEDALKHADELADLRDKQRAMKQQMKQTESENNRLAEENGALRQSTGLSPSQPHSLVEQLRFENGKLLGIIVVLANKLGVEKPSSPTKRRSSPSLTAAARYSPTSSAVLPTTIEECHEEIDRLQTLNQEAEKKYSDVIFTYRTHLIAMAQGRLEPDVLRAIQDIVDLLGGNASAS